MSQAPSPGSSRAPIVSAKISWPGGDGTASFSYADLAVALIDEIETPKHHRTLAAIAA